MRITSERIASWLNPSPDEVVGVAASAGVVEGVARVLHDVSEISSLREGKILVVNTPGRNASAVAEFTIGAILAETRLITRGHESLRKGEWRGDLYRADLTGEELSEMTVGVVGNVSREMRSVRSLRWSIANSLPIRCMKSSSGVSKLCIGSTTEARRRRVISDTPSSDLV